MPFYDTYVQVVAVDPVRDASLSDRDTHSGA